MSLISAGSISLDSTFKTRGEVIFVVCLFLWGAVRVFKNHEIRYLVVWFGIDWTLPTRIKMFNNPPPQLNLKYNHKILRGF
jgi:hypothetical protein